MLSKCRECGKEYELEDDENPSDYQCECGGDLVYLENVEGDYDDTVEEEKEIEHTCPHCGAMVPEDAKICKSCHKVLKFGVFRQEDQRITSSVPNTSKNYENKNRILSFWNKESSNSKIYGIAGAFLLIFLVGVFVIPPMYTSYTYDYRLSSAHSAIVDAQNTISQTEPLKKPIDENVQLTHKSMNSTDQAIKTYQLMYDNAPDNVTKKYAELRLKQYKENYRWSQLGIRGYEEMKASGVVVGTLSFAAVSGDEITSIKNNIGSYQNEIITLVQNNPDLKKRLNNSIGQEATEKSLQPYNPEESSIPYC